jgi:hypothetical protein
MKFHPNYIKALVNYQPDIKSIPDKAKRYLGIPNTCVKIYNNKKEIANISVVQIFKEAEYEELYNKKKEEEYFSDTEFLEYYEGINISAPGFYLYHWMEFKNENKNVGCIPVFQCSIKKETLDYMSENREYSITNDTHVKYSTIGVPGNFIEESYETDTFTGFLEKNNDGFLCWKDNGEWSGKLSIEQTDILLLNPVSGEWISVDIEILVNGAYLIDYFNGPEIPGIQFIKDIKKYGKK